MEFENEDFQQQRWLHFGNPEMPEYCKNCYKRSGHTTAGSYSQISIVLAFNSFTISSLGSYKSQQTNKYGECGSTNGFNFNKHAKHNLPPPRRAILLELRPPGGEIVGGGGGGRNTWDNGCHTARSGGQKLPKQKEKHHVHSSHSKRKT